MPLPDFADENVWRTFGALPEVQAVVHVPDPDSDWFLVAQVKQDMGDMTITKPTLTLLDREHAEFALVFADRERGEVEALARLGFKKNATVVVPRARRYRPNGAVAKQAFVRVGRDTEREVRAIPATLEQVASIVECLKATYRQRSGEPDEPYNSLCAVCQGRGEGKLRACTGCGEAKYCTKECQVKGWKAGHKASCKAIKMVKEIWLHA